MIDITNLYQSQVSAVNEARTPPVIINMNVSVIVVDLFFTEQGQATQLQSLIEVVNDLPEPNKVTLKFILEVRELVAVIVVVEVVVVVVLVVVVV